MARQQTMKAALIHSFGGIEKVTIEEVSVPTPQEGEVQIAVKCAGLNPVDWKVSEGYLKSMMEHQFPVILGWDVAGVVSQVGEGVSQFKEGDPVFAYCRKEVVRDGSFAEYICLKVNNIALKPQKLSYAQAACIPLCALTAWQSLFDTAHLKKRENVLIHAGAGGVGGFAIQFAKHIGAHVITTSNPTNFDYVKKLGADEVIDYTSESFVESIHKTYPQGVDVVYDTVGGPTLNASYLAAKEGGRLVTIAGVIDEVIAKKKHLLADFVFVRPDGKELSHIGQLFNDNKIVVPEIQEIPFLEVQSALRKSREGHTKGKLVLTIDKK
jgi:NADPH:quinone reductase-like Zn-dependent oxidoreductase